MTQKLVEAERNTNERKRSVFIKEYMAGQSNSTAGMEFALHMVNPSLIPCIPGGPLSLPLNTAGCKTTKRKVYYCSYRENAVGRTLALHMAYLRSIFNIPMVP